MNSHSYSTVGLLLLTGVAICFAPASVTDRIRCGVNDVIRPGLQAAQFTRQSLESMRVAGSDVDSGKDSNRSLADDLEIERERNRALIVELARISQCEQSERAGPAIGVTTQRLFQSSLIEAAVLGSMLADEWCSGRMIDLGSKNGIRENELVLAARKSKKTLIDLGEDSGIVTEDPLLLGRCVIGKVEHVGRWTSSI